LEGAPVADAVDRGPTAGLRFAFAEKSTGPSTSMTTKTEQRGGKKEHGFLVILNTGFGVNVKRCLLSRVPTESNVI